MRDRRTPRPPDQRANSWLASGDFLSRHRERDKRNLARLATAWRVFALIPVGIFATFVGLYLWRGGRLSDAVLATLAVQSLFFVVPALLLFFVGNNLARRSGHFYCTALSTLACLAFPLGTILGILTLRVLYRPSVQAQFRRQGLALS